MEKQMRNRRFHSTGKGSPPPYRQGKVMPQAVFGKIILAGGEVKTETNHGHDRESACEAGWS